MKMIIYRDQRYVLASYSVVEEFNKAKSQYGWSNAEAIERLLSNVTEYISNSAENLKNQECKRARETLSWVVLPYFKLAIQYAGNDPVLVAKVNKVKPQVEQFRSAVKACKPTPRTFNKDKKPEPYDGNRPTDVKWSSTASSAKKLMVHLQDRFDENGNVWDKTKLMAFIGSGKAVGPLTTPELVGKGLMTYLATVPGTVGHIQGMQTPKLVRPPNNWPWQLTYPSGKLTSLQGKGRGQSLMKRALSEFKKAGCVIVTLHACPDSPKLKNALVRFYTRFGFKPIPGIRDTGLAMMKKL